LARKKFDKKKWNETMKIEIKKFNKLRQNLPHSELTEEHFNNYYKNKYEPDFIEKEKKKYE
jgi:hypothetical protein